MAGAAADDEQVDIVELLEHSGLTAVDQRRVHNALVHSATIHRSNHADAQKRRGSAR